MVKSGQSQQFKFNTLCLGCYWLLKVIYLSVWQMAQNPLTCTVRVKAIFSLDMSGGLWKKPRREIQTSSWLVIAPHSICHLYIERQKYSRDDERYLTWFKALILKVFLGHFRDGLEKEPNGLTSFQMLLLTMLFHGSTEQSSIITLTLIILGYVCTS